ncbi:hypothetical protein V5O48_006495, partial [Marasmius crinis-equi]
FFDCFVSKDNNPRAVKTELRKRLVPGRTFFTPSQPGSAKYAQPEVPGHDIGGSFSSLLTACPITLSPSSSST